MCCSKYPPSVASVHVFKADPSCPMLFTSDRRRYWAHGKQSVYFLWHWKNGLVSKTLPAGGRELHVQRLHKMPGVMVHAWNQHWGGGVGISLGKAHHKRVISKAQGKWVLEMTISLRLKSPTMHDDPHNYKECIYFAIKGETEETYTCCFHRGSKVFGWSEVLFPKLVDPACRVSKPMGSFPAIFPMLRRWKKSRTGELPQNPSWD